ncbi:Plasma membrane t-SNARE, secretory vesicle fusion [Tulasnella sp. 331]|nr:Plasma membrane t-SNARE, secretory vesicle fusion [Tulasnella sp. 331]KAG8883477.1 Plasma membrane t-SNARE, secretory vesicle fusion [Tulasnella sp. 332]
MARDRLAAARAQRGGQAAFGDQSYPEQQQSYPTQSQQEGGYAPPTLLGGDRGQGYPGGQPSYPPTGNYSTGSGALADNSMSDFYEEITAIQGEIGAMSGNVAQISELHARSLSNTDEIATKRIESQLEGVVDETRTMMGNLKLRIQNLERKPGPGREGQVGLVKSKFKEAIQNYQDVERQSRQKYKARMERQFKIVNPNATPEEIKAVVDDEQGGQVFAQALMNSNRYGESQSAYQEVQERHKDIQKIERTITELAQLFNDMSIMVEQQDETLNAVQEKSEKINQDTEAAGKELDTAKKHAESARKKRWICFGIIVVILIIIAVVLAIELGPKKH